MAKLWAGRFGKETDLEVNDFNSSISFDCRLYKEDITGSMAHAAMLGKQGIISQQDVDDIHKGLQSILNDLHSGALEIDPNAEDVHTFVEQTLTASAMPENVFTRRDPEMIRLHWICVFT